MVIVMGKRKKVVVHMHYIDLNYYKFFGGLLSTFPGTFVISKTIYSMKLSFTPDFSNYNNDKNYNYY